MTASDVAWNSCTPWITGDDLLAVPAACNLPEGSDEDAATAATDASALLMLLSGRTITGICSTTVRPVLPSAWYPRGRCGCTFDSFCASRSVHLTGPITTITLVTVDGVDLIPDVDYAVYNAVELVRLADPATGARLHWPTNQRIDLPPTEVGTFQTIYEHGFTPPPWGKDAALELGVSLLRNRLNLDITLDPAVTNVSAGGTSLSLERASDRLRAGATTETFPAVVRFMSLVNPDGRREPDMVWSPDMGMMYEPTAFTAPGP